MECEVGEALPVPAHLLPLPASTRLLLPCPQAYARGCDPSGSLFGVSCLWPSPHPAPMERSEMSFSALPGGIKGVSRERCGKCPHFSKPQMGAQDCSHVCEGV